MNKSVIITGGGIGKRMGAGQPKQFLLLRNRPILMWTIEAFYAYDANMQILLTLPEEHVATWEKLCREFSFEITHKIIVGGKERYHSVKNALQFVSGEYVGVHDAVRPFVYSEVIRNCFNRVVEHKAVIPSIPLKDSIRELSESNSKSVDRNKYRLIQTPQVFETTLLKNAYEKPFNNLFTDDASIVESNGGNVYLVEGNEENIKITTPFDLQVAEVFFT